MSSPLEAKHTVLLHYICASGELPVSICLASDAAAKILGQGLGLTPHSSFIKPHPTNMNAVVCRTDE